MKRFLSILLCLLLVIPAIPAVATENNPDYASCLDAYNVLQTSVIPALNLSTIKNDLVLPTTGANGTTLEWKSFNPSITDAGKVNRPVATASDATGKLQVTIRKNQEAIGNQFDTTVIKYLLLTAGLYKPVDFVGVNIGNPATSGSSVFNSATKQFSVTGYGTGFTKDQVTNDQFYFDGVSLNGDFTISARITKTASSSPIVGLTVRDNLAPLSYHVTQGWANSNGRIMYRYSGKASGSTNSTVLNSTVVYEQLTKKGTTITSIISTIPITTDITATTANAVVSTTVASGLGIDANGIQKEIYAGFVIQGGISATFENVKIVTSGGAVVFDSDVVSSSGDITPPAWASGALSSPAVTQNRIDLSWKPATDNTGVINYKIYDITNSASPALIATVDGNTTSYSVRNLKSSTAYNFKVEAGDSLGNWSTDGPGLKISTTASIVDTEAPTWIYGQLSASNLSQIGVTLTWSNADDNVGVVGYNIYQGNSTNPIVRLSSTQNMYNIGNLILSTNYTFSVQAVDEAGNISTSGPNVTAATLSAPSWQLGTLSTSSSISVKPNTAGPVYTIVQNDSATLTWSGASDPIGVTGYNILLKGTLIASVDASTTTYTVAGLTPGQMYSFKVEAIDKAGYTSSDGPTAIVTMASGDSTLLPVQNLSVLPMSCDDTSLTLIWEKPDNYATANIVDYNVYMDGNKIGNANNNKVSVAKSLVDSFYADPSNSSAVKITNHNYIVTGLTPKTSHTFTVRSVDSSGKESTDSNVVTQATTATPQIVDVTKYGAIGDGTTIDTIAIQAAIDACTVGGTVLVPSGKTFKSGSLWIKGNMTLEVDGKLLGSENAADFPYADPTLKSGSKTYALINSKTSGANLQNLRIVGKGIIDGNGWKQDVLGTDGLPVSLPSGSGTVATNGILAAAEYNLALSNGFTASEAYGARSGLMSFAGVNVYFGGGLTVQNPAGHTLYVGSTNLTINGIKILSYSINNGDGVGGKGNTTIINSVIDTGDDDVCFGAGYGADAEKNPPVDSIWIFNNYYRHGHGAVTVGSGTASWVQNILAEDNIMNGTDAGFRCKTGAGTGGGARNVVFRDTAMENVASAFTFTDEYPLGAGNPAPDTGRFKHIFIKNVSVNTTINAPISLLGCAVAFDEDINLTNVTFTNSPAFSISYMKNSSFNNVKYNGAKLTATTLAATNSLNLTFDTSFAGTVPPLAQITSVTSPSAINVSQGDSVTLPSTVTAHYSDGIQKLVEVQWTPSIVDTSTVGVKTLQGSITGYTGSVSLNVNVTASVPTVAIVNVIINANFVSNQVNIQGSISSGSGKNVTLQVLDPGKTVDYVNQTTSSQDGSFSFTFTTSSVMEGNYTVKIGGEEISIPYEKTFTFSIVAPEVKKAALNTAISNATTLIASKTVGTAMGNVSQVAKNTFKSAIDVATTVIINSTATQAEVDAQVVAIDTATINFNNAVIQIVVDKAPNVLTSDLISSIKDMKLEEGTENSLTSKLNNVITSILKSDKNSSVNQLNAFINEVNAQNGKKIAVDQAGIMIQLANNIIAKINLATTFGVPSKPVLSDNNGQVTGLKGGNYDVIMNLWWGINGILYKLYEDGILIDTKTLIPNSPNAQTAVTLVSGKQNGTHRYYCELINEYGITTSDTICVNVTDSLPGKAVLSSDNWDGDANYKINMNMWWGTNGTKYKLYENGVLIETQTLSLNTPQAQAAVTSITGRRLGTYDYYCELINDAGVTVSSTMTVKVTK